MNLLEQKLCFFRAPLNRDRLTILLQGERRFLILRQRLHGCLRNALPIGLFVLHGRTLRICHKLP
ncbi:hypothetical protein D3C74_210530 [compost metagenome]